MTLRHGFWPQTHLDVAALQAMLLGNGEVRKEFDENAHYIGHANSGMSLIFLAIAK